jgi:hypothetical protein
VAGHGQWRQEVGVHELPGRLWGADLAFAQPEPTAPVVGRHGLLGQANNLPFSSSAPSMHLPLLGEERLDRVVSIGSALKTLVGRVQPMSA